LQLVL